MPMPEGFRQRLFLILPKLVEKIGTPFFIYDQIGMMETAMRLKNAFGNFIGFREFFAVKANPNRVIMDLMRRLGFGFDCSSIPELFLARDVFAQGNDIMFTSNNTSLPEYIAATGEDGQEKDIEHIDLGSTKNEKCILNLDDLSFVPKVPVFPKLICFRYNPGKRRSGNYIIGDPANSKYGVPHDQIINAYRAAIAHGAWYFGLHTMICSNELNHEYFVETLKMLLDVARMVSDELGIKFDFINIGGGFGIPYKPDDVELPLEPMARKMESLMEDFYWKNHYRPRLYMENGRYITGPHGILVTRVINVMKKYKKFVGVDACCTSSMMRPAMYYDRDHRPFGGYHNVSVFNTAGRPTEIVNVVGSACENNDQFARNRKLPEMHEGDIVFVEDAGAHCWAMANNYNNRLRLAEYMLLKNGDVAMIRRAETMADLFATQITDEPKVISLS